MNATRIVIWPILLVSYVTLCVAMIHALLGNWSGAASLGMFFVAFVGAPSLAGYAGYLWRKKLIRGWVKTEAALCAAVPLAIVLLLAAAALIGKR